MANPRRNSYANNNEFANSDTEINNPFPSQTLASKFSRLKLFLKKPHAFPFLLSIFLILTWVFLRIQQPKSNFPPDHAKSSSGRSRFSIGDDRDPDRDANLFRFPSGSASPITKDGRGWLLDPVSVALDSGIPGGASICASIHVGEIRPGNLRGNHRHHTCNETFLIWGARTLFRMENEAVSKGYAQVMIEADEVAVAVSPSGTAHALVNMDSKRATFFVGCQDSAITYNSSTSDFNVWKDLTV